ncbi:MAG: hypothetical protein IPN76_06740 [Saprospiraceae bacterium]|nr:hypothetical protein [Saprospiraceae bacterium]
MMKLHRRVGALENRVAELMAENESLRSNVKKEDENLLNLLNSYKDSNNRPAHWRPKYR